MKVPMRTGFFLFFLAFLLPAPVRADLLANYDQTAAVILVYHRIGEDAYPQSNITLDQFADHVDELLNGGYTVMPLSSVIHAFENGKALPPRTVVLTFDGGYRSAFENGIPLLEENGLPYTVFVSSGLLDQAGAQYMGWGNLRTLKKSSLAGFGIHPARYDRLHGLPEADIARQINSTRAAFRKEMGENPSFFAYPFGEYDAPYKTLIEKQGFTAAFAQNSGVAYAGADMFALPRFAMTESYGDRDRFRMVASALPFPVRDVEPADPHIKTANPAIGFTTDSALASSLDAIRCFVSGQDKPTVERLGETRVELRLSAPLTRERVRVNCTLPSGQESENGEVLWRWFGMLLTVGDQ